MDRLRFSVFIVILLIQISGIESEYGNSCNGTNPCPETYFVCSSDQTCRCHREDSGDSFFSAPDTCHTYVGKGCTNPEDGTQIEPSCAPNANCDLDSGKCICDSRFLPNIDHTKCSLPYGDETCEPEPAVDLCDETRFFQCDATSSSCLCRNPTQAWYESSTNICNLRVGADITCADMAGLELEQKCALNSFCDSLKSKTCICDLRVDPNLVPNSEGRCFIPYSKTCKASLCDPAAFLSCVDEGRCDCADGSWFDPDKNACLLLVNSKCDVDGPQECVDNGYCNEETGQCACTAPTTPNAEGKCSLNHWDDCRNNQNSCNPLNFLICDLDTNTCECANRSDSWYDVAGQTCYRLANALCTKDEMHCVPNSICNPETNQCTCLQPTSPNADRKCQLAFNQTCDSELDICDPTGFLTCGVDGRCVCGEGSWFDDTFQTCYLLSNSECEQGEGSEPCTPNAACNPISGECECVTGFRPNADRKCSIGYGWDCKENPDSCDPLCFLTCGTESELCECDEAGEAWFNETEGACFRLAEAECSPGGMPCVPNSVCNSTCTCISPASRNEEGQCRLRFNQTCSPDHDICEPLSFLKCNELTEVCACEEGSWYDRSEGKCSLLAESNCQNDPGGQGCIQNSVCVPATEDPDTGLRCTCNPGYDQNPLGFCYKSYGRECTLGASPDPCDPYEFLACGNKTDPLNPTCQCSNENAEFVNGACRLVPSSPCTESDPPCADNADCIDGTCSCTAGFDTTPLGLCLRSHGSSCSPTAPCNYLNSLECIGGECLCRSGYMESSAKPTRCSPGYMQPCNSSLSCSTAAYLRCSGLTCDCLAPGEQRYDGILQKCLSMLDHRCHLYVVNLTNTLQCIENAECVKHEDEPLDNYGRCACKWGFVVRDETESCMAGARREVPIYLLILLFPIITLSITFV